MNTIVIDDKLINLDKVHFVRRINEYEILISFGSDFLRFKGSAKKIEEILIKLQNGNNEKLSDNYRR